MSASWSDLPSHRSWLDSEGDRLIDFAWAAVHPTAGFAWLDARGTPELDRPVHTWITARMTHAFALAQLASRAGA
jgi:mannose/cellobiose epimerase-like protein (N-acyl-D-glucosamine 2-epimerase family)